jgi:hypothetical protein
VRISRRLRRSFAFAGAALLVAAATGAPVAPAAARPAQDDASTARSWSIEPDPTGSAGELPNFSFVAGAGTTIDDTVRITNLGSEPLELDLYAADVVLTEGGGIDMAAAGARPTAVGAWIDLPADTVTVPVGEGVDVPFELTVPEGTAAGDRTGGIVTSLSVESTDDVGRPVVSEMRLVSRVQVRVPGPVDASLGVSDLTFDHHGSASPVASGSATVTYTVTNTGNVRAGAEQVVRLRGLFGMTGREAVLDDIPELLPGASVDVEVAIGGVWPAVRTTASVELRARIGAVGDGEGQLQASTTTTSTSAMTFPWPQVIVAAVVAVAWWWKRRSDRARIERAVTVAVAEATGRGAATPSAPAEPVAAERT